MNIHKIIRKKLHIHRGDTSPYVGWGMTSRKDLGEIFCELGYTYGAEVGVAYGKNAKMFFNTNSNLKLMCVDPWGAFKRNTAQHMEMVCQKARQRLKNKNIIWKRLPSLDAAKEVKNDSLDFVYIDGLHEFDNIMLDIVNWTPKVRIGGIVSGHDYMFAPREGVIQAVNAYTMAHRITELYITKDRKECQSWFFVREK